MPTDEWFSNNPKVSAYIPKKTDQALKDWMDANGIRKMSHALNRILSEYLGSAQTQAVDPIVSDDRLETIEARLEEIESRLKMPESIAEIAAVAEFEPAQTIEACRVCNVRGTGFTRAPSVDEYYLCPQHSRNILKQMRSVA